MMLTIFPASCSLIVTTMSGILGAPFSRVVSTTLNALSTHNAILFGVPIGILFGIFMALRTMSFSAVLRTNMVPSFNGVLSVFLFCSVLQIVSMIVQVVVVKMAYLQALRTLTMKGQCYQLMDLPILVRYLYNKPASFGLVCSDSQKPRFPATASQGPIPVSPLC